MGKFYERYLKDPKNITKQSEAAHSYAASLVLGKEFGENVESFYKRKPDLKRQHDEALSDAAKLDEILAKTQTSKQNQTSQMKKYRDIVKISEKSIKVESKLKKFVIVSRKGSSIEYTQIEAENKGDAISRGKIPSGYIISGVMTFTAYKKQLK